MEIPKTCNDCSLRWDRKGNVKDIVLCPLHAAAPKLLEALEQFLTIEIDGDCGECYICSEHELRMENAINVARAAILEAKGE